MRTSLPMKHCKLLIFVGLITFSTSCGTGHQFRQPAVPTENTPIAQESADSTLGGSNAPVTDTTTTITPPPLPTPAPKETPTPPKDPVPVACSTLYQIPGTANPFLAGMPDGTEIQYPSSVDRAPVNAPILVTPTDRQCFEAGRMLFFRVEGKIAHGAMSDQESDADGIATAPGAHTLGNLNGLASLKAPINSLIGVFLSEAPNGRTVAPPSLDFSEPLNRNFKSLSPRLGQLFFIGDGKDAMGSLQGFVVPSGTTRLYLAIMDEYEWNNNLGKLSGGILWVKP